jgi:glycosyltransferase involved in cell wall biosynthesis
MTSNPPNQPGTHRRSLVFIADRLEPRLGMEKALLALLEVLNSEYEIHLVVLAGPPSRVPVTHVTWLGCDSGVGGRLRALPALRRLAASAGSFPVGVGIWATATYLIATVGLGARVLLWEHSVLPWRLRHERRIFLAGILLRMFSRRLQGVAAVSRATARTTHWLVWPFVHPSVVPNCLVPDTGSARGTSAVIAEPTTGPSSSTIVQLVGVGSLNKRKNWTLALQALSLLPPEYRLSIAGDGPERPALQRMIEHLDLADRARLLGYRPDVPSLLDGATIVVQPSLAETFGYALMEAAERDKPVVCIAKPVMDEFVPELVAGVCAAPTPATFAEAILQAQQLEFDFSDARSRRAIALDAERIKSLWAETLTSPR